VCACRIRESRLNTAIVIDRARCNSSSWFDSTKGADNNRTGHLTVCDQVWRESCGTARLISRCVCPYSLRARRAMDVTSARNANAFPNAVTSRQSFPLLRVVETIERHDEPRKRSNAELNRGEILISARNKRR